MLRLLLDANDTLVLVEVDHAKRAGILHRIAEHHGTALGLHPGLRALQHAGQVLAVEHVVTQHKRTGLASKELSADGKCLCQATWLSLLGIVQPHSKLAAIPQKLFKCRQVSRSRDDENLANARKHQHAQGVVH